MGAALKGSTALVTGGGSGIGLGAAKAFAVDGASVLIVGRSQDKLDAALEELSPLVHDGASVSSLSTDVTEESQVEAAVAAAGELPGKLSIAVASAGDGTIGPIVGTSVEEWDRVQSVSLRGVFLTFKHAGAAIAANGGGALVAVSSLAGLLTHRFMGPYNVAKAGVKTFTELLAHEIRGQDAEVTTHLLIPGFTFTDLTRGERAQKPAGAWEPGQVADFLVEAMGRGDFYILCPDNEVSRDLDAKRMEWAMGDIIHNRPPLSRWHPDWGGAFAAFLKDG